MIGSKYVETGLVGLLMMAGGLVESVQGFSNLDCFSQNPLCSPSDLGDGICDVSCNFEECGFDDGDCFSFEAFVEIYTALLVAAVVFFLFGFVLAFGSIWYLQNQEKDTPGNIKVINCGTISLFMLVALCFGFCGVIVMHFILNMQIQQNKQNAFILPGNNMMMIGGHQTMSPVVQVQPTVIAEPVHQGYSGTNPIQTFDSVSMKGGSSAKTYHY